MTKTHFKFGVLIPFFHIVLLYSLFTTQHPVWVLCFGWLLYYPIHVLGYTAFYHKLMAHRAFEPKPWYPYVGTFLGMLSFHGNPITSALLHRLHHKYSDTDKDPSDRNKGVWYAYIGWAFKYQAPRREWVLVNDLRKEYPWLLQLDKFIIWLPIMVYGIAYLINRDFGTSLLFGGLLAFHAPLISNGFLHWIKDGVAQPVDNRFLALWFNPGANHATHHNYPKRLEDSTYDWSAFIVRKFLSK